MGRTALLLLFLVPGYNCVGEDCAANFASLGGTDRLREVQSLFQEGAWLGLVNETKGSYITIVSHDDKMTITLFTSGLFDLYPIQRQGAVTFCDDGHSLKINAFDRIESLTVRDGKLIVGAGGPKRTFSVGSLPDSLRRLHHLDARGIASD